MKTFEDAEGRIGKLLEESGIPGCSVAVVDRNDTIWTQGFGLADIATSRPALPSTVYHLFSGTKIFTATAILQLVERGVLDIEADATKYMPDLPRLEGISLRDLLSHASGLKDTPRGFLSVYFEGDEPPTTNEALARYRISSGGTPGEKAQYRNLNYAILGEIVSRVSGLPFSEYLLLHVLAPIGSQANFDLLGLRPADMATGYIGRWDPTRLVLRLLMPEVSRRIYRHRNAGLVALNDYGLATQSIGGLVGSVEDFSAFLQSQLDGGGPLLSETSTRQMQTIVSEGRAGYKSRLGVGLGWKIGTANDHAFINHEGGGAGFTSEMRLYPDAGIGIVVAMNRSSMTKTMRVAHLICELIYSVARRSQ